MRVRRLVVCGILLLLAALGVWAVLARRDADAGPVELLADVELTARRAARLAEADRRRLRNVEVLLPESWPEDSGAMLFPVHPGPWASPHEKAVHTGMLSPIMAQYSRSVFQLAHPRIRVRFTPLQLWGEDYRSVLLVAMQSGRAPALFVARHPQKSISDGLYADITEIVGGQQWVSNLQLASDRRWLARHPNVWANFHRQPVLAKRLGTLRGRAYVVTEQKLTANAIAYRKDWYEWVARKRGWDRKPDGALCGPAQHPWGAWGPHPAWRYEDFINLMRAYTQEARLIAEREIELYTPADRLPATAEQRERRIAMRAAEIRGLSADMRGYDGGGGGPWFVPDLSGRFTWRFIGVTDEVVDSIVRCYLLRNVEQVVHSDPKQGWSDRVNDFQAGRAGMISYLSHLIATEAIRTPFIFSSRVSYAEAVGMMPPPNNRFGLRVIEPDANICAFNPYARERRLRVYDPQAVAKLRRRRLGENAGRIVARFGEAIEAMPPAARARLVDPLTGRRVRAPAAERDILRWVERLSGERFCGLWLGPDEDHAPDERAVAALERLREQAAELLRPAPEDLGGVPVVELHFGVMAGEPNDSAIAALRRTIERVTAAAPSAKVRDPLTGTDPLALGTADPRQGELLWQIADRLAYETTADLPDWLATVDPDQRTEALEALYDGHRLMSLMARRRDLRLRAAFEWIVSIYYGRMFLDRLRVSQVRARLLGEGMDLPLMLLAMPFEPTGEAARLLGTEDLTRTFPPEYIETTKLLKRYTDIPPLHHEYGLVDPGETTIPYATWSRIYQDVLTVDFKADSREALIAQVRAAAVQSLNKYGQIINKSLDKKQEDDRRKLSRYYTAWARYFADRPQYRAYFDGFVVPFCRKYCPGLVDLEAIHPAASRPSGRP
jgi:hypothetical protein